LPMAASAALPVAEGVTAHPMQAKPPSNIPAAIVLCLCSENMQGTAAAAAAAACVNVNGSCDSFSFEHLHMLHDALSNGSSSHTVMPYASHTLRTQRALYMVAETPSCRQSRFQPCNQSRWWQSHNCFAHRRTITYHTPAPMLDGPRSDEVARQLCNGCNAERHHQAAAN
jgi:hypothetical protein